MIPFWCWRCRSNVPMLDDVESAEAWALYTAAIRSLKAFETGDAPIPPEVVRESFAPVRTALLRFTGDSHDENYAHAVMHHRRSLYGAPCGACGRPLRTPQARHCAACGTAVDADHSSGQ